MLSPFICGTFQHDEDRDELGAVTPTPKRSSAKKHGSCRTHNSHRNRNPYSTRGLDKFEALLADLEEKKKKIYTKNDPGNISLVRFSYTSSNNLVPIVVKLKGKDSRSGSPPGADETSKDKHVVRNTDAKRSGSELKAGSTEKKKAGDKNKRSSWKPWRPYYYVSAAVILILVLLLFFGRSVAILCTTVGWYAIPTLKGGSSGGKKAAGSEKKRELARRSSENKIVVTGQSPDRSPRQHGHRRSW